MNRTSHVLLIFLVLWPLAAFAAPVGNIGEDSSLFRDDPSVLFVTSFRADRQVNTFPTQTKRFPWTDPSSSYAEERHYSQSRKSETTITALGAKVGIAIEGKGAVYALVGNSTSSIDLTYGDWTVAREFTLDDSFESGPDLYYGAGITAIMHQGEYRSVPLTFGLDLSYRHLTIEEDRLAIADEQTYYKSDLDEIQLAFSLSADLGSWSPYAGLRVSSITGSEEYINRLEKTYYFPEEYIHYNEDITWFKNTGYVAGVTTSIKGWFSLGVEVRFGDEKGLGLNATTRF